MTMENKGQAKIGDPIDLLRAAYRFLSAGEAIPERILDDDRSCQESLDVLTDLACIDVADAEHSFTVRSGVLETCNLPFRTPAPTFRDSGGPAILHSDVFPLEKDYLLVELSSTPDGWDLLLEKGSKKGSELAISLYKGDNLMEFLLIKNRIRRSLSRLESGKYRLLCGEKTLLNFSIFDEDKDYYKGRGHNRQD